MFQRKQVLDAVGLPNTTDGMSAPLWRSLSEHWSKGLSVMVRWRTDEWPSEKGHRGFIIPGVSFGTLKCVPVEIWYLILGVVRYLKRPLWTSTFLEMVPMVEVCPDCLLWSVRVWVFDFGCVMHAWAWVCNYQRYLTALPNPCWPFSGPVMDLFVTFCNFLL